MTDTEAQSAPPSTPVDEKPQPERKVLATLIQGTVKWFNVRNGYGFINRNDTKEDVFVHQTAIKKNNPRKFLRSVGDGEIVEFDVIEAAKGSEAANVTGPGGVPVKGSRYAPNKRRFRRRFYPRSPRPGSQPRAEGTEGEGTTEEDARPPTRHRRPYRPRPQDVESGEQNGVAEGDQQRPPRRRFWRPYRRPFRPRQPAEQSASDQATPQDSPEQEPKGQDSKGSTETEVPQTNGEASDGQGQKQRRPSRRRRQRNSESSTSKNDTEKSASETETPPQTSTPSNLKAASQSPKTSPKTNKSPTQTTTTE